MDITPSAEAVLARWVLQPVVSVYYLHCLCGYFLLISPQLPVVKFHLMERSTIL